VQCLYRGINVVSGKNFREDCREVYIAMQLEPGFRKTKAPCHFSGVSGCAKRYVEIVEKLVVRSKIEPGRKE